MSSTCSGVSVSSCISTVGASQTFSITHALFAGSMYALAFIFVVFVAWKQYSGLGPDKVTIWSLFTSIIWAVVMAFSMIGVVHSIIN